MVWPNIRIVVRVLGLVPFLSANIGIAAVRIILLFWARIRTLSVFWIVARMNHTMPLLLSRAQSPQIAFVEVDDLVKGELIDVAGDVGLHQLEEVGEVEWSLVG